METTNGWILSGSNELLWKQQTIGFWLEAMNSVQEKGEGL